MLAFLSDTGILVAVIAFVALFGASQIPKLARNLGEAGKEFRKAHAELEPVHPSAPASAPASVVAPAPVAAPAAVAEVSAADDRVTLSREQFERLLATRVPAAPADH